MLSFIVAMSENYVIGKNGNVPWHLPADLKIFKEITSSGTKTMIMGRKTFESLPKVLPGRKHIILTGNKDYKVNDSNIEVIHSIDELTPYINSFEEYFVIGGGEIFSLLFPYVKRLYLTIIHHDFEGDTYFPNFDKSQWKVTKLHEGKIDADNKYKHTYLLLEWKGC
ncbi:dihydrofolate reductase [Clostridium sp. SYSU_GA19001]|uniref:dihydrofolate reductase n=1 Tax=Clostridium caldaquaticum TaxID=2940653 RepID=UPI002076F3D1|nr:dihydrofolate reductase [Clostridium caldaquaticum]MCM8710203.1 dihydrofolate reductase [Clostridium caldaquaticum]